jgi:hypothetical protein
LDENALEAISFKTPFHILQARASEDSGDKSKMAKEAKGGLPGNHQRTRLQLRMSKCLEVDSRVDPYRKLICMLHALHAM